MGIFSEELAELDRNTVDYMIDNLKKENVKLLGEYEQLLVEIKQSLDEKKQLLVKYEQLLVEIKQSLDEKKQLLVEYEQGLDEKKQLLDTREQQLQNKNQQHPAE